jgi:hypothetical protein
MMAQQGARILSKRPRAASPGAAHLAARVVLIFA